MSELTTKDFYKPYFLQTHSDFKNIFYDTDMKEIRKLVKQLSDVLKDIELRVTRHETIQIAKSVFDYESQKDLYFQYPHMFYDFRCDDVRICIAKKVYRRHDEYFVNCVGFNPTHERFADTVGHFGYGHSDTLNGVLTLFCDIVNDFLSSRLSALF